MRYGLLILLLWIPLLASADIYQWTDSQGLTHFSDTPMPGATSVKLNDDAITTDDAPVSTPPVIPPVSTDNTNTDAGPGRGYYSSVSIVQPLTQATIFNNSGQVEVSIATKPDLRANDKAIMLVDGKPMETTQNENVLQVQGVERGEHTVRVQIQDKKGTAVATSNIITIYMRRPINTALKARTLQGPIAPLHASNPIAPLHAPNPMASIKTN